MADEAIGDAAEATAAEGGIVVLAPNPEAEAAEQEAEGAAVVPEPEVLPPPPALADATRLDDLTVRVEALELGVAGLRSDLTLGLEAKAPVEHAHELPEDVQLLADELRAQMDEEMAPRRSRLPARGWLLRRGRGGGR